MLAIFSVIGMMLIASSDNLLSLYLALELQSLPIYVLAAIDKTSVKSSEAGVKYLVLGVLSSAVMVYGISVIYSVGGILNFSEGFICIVDFIYFFDYRFTIKHTLKNVIAGCKKIKECGNNHKINYNIICL